MPKPVTSTEPEVTHHDPLDAQLCVPGEWTDSQILDLIESLAATANYSAANPSTSFTQVVRDSSTS